MPSLKAYLWLFAALTLSGLLLLVFYTPSAAPPNASMSVPTQFAAGRFSRGVHFWIAQIAVVAVLIYFAGTVFVKTNHKYIARAASLLLLTCLLWFTGMLLPWDQLGFWLSHLSGRFGLRASTDPNEGLYAVYWTHTVALSLLTAALLIFYTCRRSGSTLS